MTRNVARGDLDGAVKAAAKPLGRSHHLNASAFPLALRLYGGTDGEAKTKEKTFIGMEMP